MDKAYGADLSLNHGAIVAVTMEGTSVTGVDSIFSWTKKDNHSLKLKSSPSALYSTARDLVLSIPGEAVLVLDWSGQSVYWRTTKLFVVQMGLFLGMVYALAKKRKISVLEVTPKELREYFNQPQKLPKKELQDYVLLLFPPPHLFLTWATEDDIDAYILAIYTILKNGENAHDG